MIKSKFVTGRILFAGVVATFASVAQSEVNPSAFVMTVIQDRAQGAQVVRGDYERAIGRLVAQRKRKGFSANNNLCVAYTKTNKLSEAERACAKAVESSKSASGLWYDMARKRDYAVALSNRGVIRALMGDNEGAREDFRQAMKFTKVVRAPAENLALLETRNSETVSALQ